jgi:HEPN domain-containing protein
VTKESLDKDKLVRHWIESSDEDFDAKMVLFESKKYSWALFVGHLMIEKLLKALFVKENGQHPPLIHNLYRLAELSKIDLTDEQSDMLDKITTFNINARYEDYKKEFSSLCTFDFTKNWIEKINIIRSWIKMML